MQEISAWAVENPRCCPLRGIVRPRQSRPKMQRLHSPPCWADDGACQPSAAAHRPTVMSAGKSSMETSGSVRSRSASASRHANILGAGFAAWIPVPTRASKPAGRPTFNLARPFRGGLVCIPSEADRGGLPRLARSAGVDRPKICHVEARGAVAVARPNTLMTCSWAKCRQLSPRGNHRPCSAYRGVRFDDGALATAPPFFPA